ncbi:MAG: hypothetical protein EOO90_02935 [Pedobacter sp.]|nr:MAG: hypothetical protein EOO90_02935 [Pedobacter sp.]
MYTGLLAGFSVLLQYLIPDVRILATHFWLVFSFCAIITFIAYVLAYLGLKRNPEVGVMAIMASVAVKMFFAMAFVLIYSINTKERGLIFPLNFFSLYLLFSFFEIFSLLRNLRHQNKK